MVARLEAERRRLTDPPELDRVVLGQPVRNRRVGRVRDAVQQLLPPLRRLLVLGLDLLELRLQLLQLLELLGRRLALRLRLRPEVARLRLELSPARVGLEQLVEGPGGSLAGEGGAVTLGIGPRGSEVDQPFVVR